MAKITKNKILIFISFLISEFLYKCIFGSVALIWFVNEIERINLDEANPLALVFLFMFVDLVFLC